MYSGIILEGISGTGKTSIFQGITQSPAIHSLPAMSKLLLSEHHTQRTLEKREQQGSLLPSHHIELMDEIVSFIEKLQQRTQQRGWSSTFLQSHGIFFLLERFHLTHVFRFPYMKWPYVTHLDQRLSQLNALLCLLTVNAGILEKRLFSRQSECWLNYLKQYGNTSTEIVDTLIQRQHNAIEMARLSAIPLLLIDTSCTSSAEVTHMICSHFLTSG